MSITELNQKYIGYATWLDTYVDSLNKINDQSLNVHIEDTIVRLMNIAFGYSFKNANMDGVNAKAIDAIDTDNRIALQITSTTTFKKISSTVEKYVDEDGIYEDYDQLLIFFLRRKKEMNPKQLERIEEIADGKVEFDNSHLIDFLSLKSFLSEDYNKLEAAVNLLEKEVPNLKQHISTKDRVSLGLSFPFTVSNEELNMICEICSLFINANYKIFTANKILVDSCKSESIFLVDNKLKLPKLDLCLVVLSEKDFEDEACMIIDKSLEEKTSFQNIAFEKISSDKASIIKTNSYVLINENNLESKTNAIVSKFRKKKKKKSKQQNITEELIDIYSSFSHSLRNKDDESQKLYKYHILQEDDMIIKFLEIRKNVPSFLAVKNEFRKEFPNDKKFTILVHKDPHHKNPERRKRSLEKLFEVNKCEYISDKVGKRIKKKFKLKPLLKSTIFIEPMVTDYSMSEKGNIGLSELLDWFNQESSPILFLIGQGGIGKTTICKKLHDQLISEEKIVLYINAFDLVSKINDSSFKVGNDAYDLYSFYTKWQPTSPSHVALLSRSEFYSNLSNGNIRIIFDGLDEIVSSKPSFDIGVFLNYIESLTEISNLAKIVISMRDYQYKLIKKGVQQDLFTHYDTFKVELFTAEMAEQYFKTKFPHSPKYLRQCMEAISRFDIDKEVFKYPPYLLFLISMIIPADDEVYDDINLFSDESFDFDKKILFDNILIEYLNRELGKKTFIGLGVEIPDQIQMLEDLAYQSQNKFTTSEANYVIKKIKKNDFSDEFFRKLKDHPYFYFNEETDTFEFQFDFLKDHLRARKLKSVILDGQQKDYDLEMIGKCLKPETILYKHLLDRVINKPYIIINYIKQLVIKRLEGDLSFDIENAISNLFIMALEIIGKGKTPTDYTKVLLRIFEKEKDSGIIEGLVFNDCPHAHGFVFDFSGLIISKSLISNYSRMFECSYDENTLFTEDCILNQISEATSETSARMSNFDENISGDKTYLDIMLKKDEKYSEINSISIKSFKKVLSLLLQKSDYLNFNRLKRPYLTDRKFDDTTLILTLNILTEEKVLFKKDKSYRIIDSEIDNVNMFLENTFFTKNIGNAIRKFKAKMKTED